MDFDCADLYFADVPYLFDVRGNDLLDLRLAHAVDFECETRVFTSSPTNWPKAMKPLHLLHLKETLEKIPDVRKLISGLKSEIVREIAADLDALPRVIELVGRAIADDPPATVAEGQVIRQGFNRELDELRGISRNAREIISMLERSEREKSGITSLKIKYNRVFGYFIEVTNPHLKLVPDRYIRKQTLVNAERFLTPELKELEEKILKAEEKIGELEKKLYFQVLTEIQRESSALNRNSEAIARLDVVSAGGELAQRRNYVRPN